MMKIYTTCCLFALKDLSLTLRAAVNALQEVFQLESRSTDHYKPSKELELTTLQGTERTMERAYIAEITLLLKLRLSLLFSLARVSSFSL